MALAAQGLKKKEENLSFAEIIKFFARRQKNQFEIFGGCSKSGSEAA